ncbi:type I polyketide synthase [Actinomadura sp. WMMB 499]|uniref:type I polyketide synthase n=1 Tax=Actinomadura sp. WMMB 499 TaxID=1219491 RepID=UPI0012459D5E|nr:type I polyketide synthase [Actinomadura sp. WMMB 499]QFG20255.1 SDR family NAD(P)-dependent oxidoreductase [Actinomadura sp. WMMB 499]
MTDRDTDRRAGEGDSTNGGDDRLRDYLRRVTAELRHTRRRLDDAENRASEPIAVVGVACRYPGDVASPEDLGDLVEAGGDAITGFPVDRGWNVAAVHDPDRGRPGTSYVDRGGFVHGAAGFDAEFFGISPREALAMDPQQRMFLEVAWEALERTGLDPRSLRGSRTGVFAGAGNPGYLGGIHQVPAEVEGYSLTGNVGSVVSGRVSYTLGLEGPAVTLDTACSSSLVAIHLACRELRTGECSLALAGGVTVLTTPWLFVEFSRQNGLAPDGRCKAFAADADGTIWGEGAGVVVLERLSDAVRNGRRIWGVIRGSAMNQDGASSGLSAPNGPSQQRVIRRALADARLSGADVDVVEAHGTGTSLGDPIEAQALLATYGQDRPQDRPLWLGSVKSNIGHTAAAAGIAGVIKMLVAFQRPELPPTLHVEEPSREVDWSSGAVRLLTQAREWPTVDRPRRAAVSSFGISGTNAHLILEQAPDAPPAEQKPPPVVGEAAWVLSGRGEGALREQARRLAAWSRAADGADEPGFVARVAEALRSGRSLFEDRAVVLGADAAEMAQALEALAAGSEEARVVTGRTPRGPAGKTVFVFPGQGSQWAGMGRVLMDESPVFAAAMRACGEALAEHVDWSPAQVLEEPEDSPVWGRTDVVQPLLFAVMVSLARLWQAHGVRPDTVIGHSQGEIAAAHIAGALTLPDAARVVALRSALLTRLEGAGGMAHIAAPPADIPLDSAEGAESLAVAAVNGPASTTVSGPDAALEELIARCHEQGFRAKRIPVAYPSHHPAIDALHDDLIAALEGLAPRTPTLDWVSTTTGERNPRPDPGYWFTNLRHTVQLHPTVTALSETHTTYIEVSPHPILTTDLTHTLTTHTLTTHTLTTHTLTTHTLTTHSDEREPLIHHTLKRDHHTLRAHLHNLAHLHTRTHHPVTYTPTPPHAGHTAAHLPTYPFQHRHYWVSVDGGTGSAVTGPSVDGWRYETVWRPSPGAARTLSGHWLVVAPQGHPLGAPVAETLVGLGAEAHLADARGARELRAELEISGVVSLLGLTEEDGATAPTVPAGLAATLELVRWHTEGPAGVPLWCLTRAAVRTDPQDAPPDPAQAMLWGLGRVAALEHPRHWGGLIDLPGDMDERVRARLAEALGNADGEDQLAVRSAGVTARRLVRARPGGSRADRTWRPEGTTLVTGGTGALGVPLAKAMAGRGAAHLVLASRRGADAPGAAEAAAELTALGTRVTFAACDVTDRAAVEELALRCEREGAPIRSVVHAAVVGDLAPLARLNPADLASALAAKVGGARVLDDVFAGRDLDSFVLFSSITAVWGSGDHGAYAAANAYLDALAERRRAEGRPVTSVAWGIWAALGEEDADRRRELTDRAHRQGLVPLDPAPAFAALWRVLDRGDAAPVVADVDWDRFLPMFTVARPSRLFAEIAPSGPGSAGAAGADERVAAAWRERFAGLPAAERDRALVELVRADVAGVLGHGSAEAVEPERAFNEIGFDSLTAVELRNRLIRATGLPLPATLVFDHPTVAAVARLLAAELTGAGAAPAAPAAPAVRADDDPLVIVGMACRFPGGVRSPEDLWELVLSGTDAIGDFPADRGWDLDGLFDPDPDRPRSTYTRRGGFLYDAADFDAEPFGISPREALAMDPQQRVLLETAWELFERAGIDPGALRGSPTGTFVGCNLPQYGGGIQRVPEDLEGHLLTGSNASVVSGRVAYTFGLEGPAVTVDTACSSSLVALHLAARAVRDGECTLAVAGGVGILTSPDPFVGFSRQRVLSPDGRCKAFGAGADGIGLAEGAGLVLIERLSHARRHHHPVLALLRSTATNQDGASNGLSAPNGPAQQRVIHQALTNAHLTPTDIDTIETHGTGTPLGDPIEAQALHAVYGRDRPAHAPLWIGSVKSNIGHPAAAAGIAGVIKTVQALRHGVMPPTLHADEPSPHVDWSAGTVRVLTGPVRWPDTGRPRRAGVSSFGISGTNAHLILEQAPDPEPQPDPEPEPGGPIPWVLSGATETALRDQAARLHAWTADGAEPAGTVARALATTRASLAHRAVVVGADPAELRAGLAALAAGTPSANVVTGSPAAGERPVFVFPGQGAQWAGMGRGLMAEFPVFADWIDECEQALGHYVDWSLREVLDGADAEALGRIDHLQPVLFAVMTGLARVWRSWGVEPGAVIGHSQGEVAAAHVAGALSLDDALRVVVLRSRLFARDLAGRGAVAAVGAGAGRVRGLLGRWKGELALAGVNGPSAVMVAGPADLLGELVQECARQDVRARVVPLTVASHGPQVDPLREELLDLLAPVTPRPARVPFCSTVTGGFLDTSALGAQYWFDNARRPVDFAGAVDVSLAAGHRAFVECGPHPLLIPNVTEIADGQAVRVAAIGSLRRGEGGADRLLRSAGEASVQGVAVDWPAILGSGRRAALPTYAFQRRRYWLDSTAGPAGGEETDPGRARFWTAVERGDAAELAGELGLDETVVGEVLPALSGWHRTRRERAAAGAWRYDVAWPAAGPGAGPAPAGTWLVVLPDDTGTWADPLAGALAEAGLDAVRVRAGDLRADDGTSPAAPLHAVPADGPFAGVLSLLAADAGPHPGHPAVPRGVADTLAVLRALIGADTRVPLWCVTRGAVATGAGDPVDDPAQAQLWGLGRVVALEHPRLWGGLVDLPACGGADEARHLCAALARTDGEDQVAVRASGPLVRRLVRAAAPAPVRSWRPRDATLVTGGGGPADGRIARWLVARGARHLVLTHSGDAAPGVRALAEELAEEGARITLTRCDLTDRAALRALAHTLAAAGTPVRTVLHTAATGELAGVADTGLPEYAAAVAAKVDGARALAEVFDEAGEPLDALVFFSSIAGVWGSGDHGAYAAANAHLDALAQWRRARGLPATSIAWGVWDVFDDPAERAIVEERSTRYGLPLLDPGLALAALGRTLDRDETFAAVADVDWAAFLPLFSAARPTRLADEIPEAREAADRRADDTSDEAATALRARLADLDETGRGRLLVDLVREHAAAVLGHGAPGAVERDRAFREMGLDSITAVELRNRLGAATGLRLPATLVFDHPSADALAAHLAARLSPDGAAESPALDGLRALEDACAGLAPGDAVRDEVGARLRALLWRLTDPDAAPDAPGEPGAASDIDDATATEMFELIDKELGPI